MVIMVHAGEPFYIGAGGAIIRDNAFWVNTYGSFLRSCVPMFVLLSGYLLLPVKETTSVFYKKRFARILIPFLVWSVVYAVVPYLLGEYGISGMVKNLLMIPVNFSDKAGHLWFVYMLIGLYLFIPILSPWIKGTSKKEEEGFLMIWGLTLSFPFLKTVFPEILGEAYWNPISTAYYFSGYLGYLVLGHYLKTHVHLPKGRSRAIGALLLVAGYAITWWGFDTRMETAPSIPALELTWAFLTINVAMMTTGLFLLVKDLNGAQVRAEKVLADLSNLSFGIYLAHLLVLNQMHQLLDGVFPSLMVTIPVVAFTTFVLSYLLVKGLSYLPKSKYLVG
jgi:surface polysaccharide O-acyltransferase-like enzyme